MSAPAVGTPRARLRLLIRAAEYELRKVSVFRTGFLVREVLSGVFESAAMVAVFWALYEGDTERVLRGWTLPELVRYLIGVAVFTKLVFHNRVLDVAEQIFEGTFTKYLVMPFPYFLLPLARWLQYTAVQLGVVVVLWAAGAWIAPQWWPFPADVMAVPEALALTLLGSLCFLELFVILNFMAFWLEVVWSLLVMTWFVTSFIGGRLVPVSQMPAPVAAVLEWLFPYWAIAAPVERFMGRLGSADTLHGIGLLAVSLVLLDLLRRFVWARGKTRYAGGGM